MQEVIERSRRVLELPDDYRIGIVPASDTGAFEMCLWSLLGPRGVDVLSWESFGQGWVTDITRHLKLEDSRVFSAAFGHLPDLFQVDCDRDVVFAWNGTTSGVSVPDGNWIPPDREGLVICDATSAVFAMELPWDKIDVATYSWQKVLGGEAAHGMLILSPRAVGRIENYTPPWPLPKLFRLKKGGKLNDSIFRGDTINTPSLLAVEDAIDGLRWAEEIGGLRELVRRSRANLAVLERWEAARDWISFLAETRDIRSSTSVCFRITDPSYVRLTDVLQRGSVRQMTTMLEAEEVAYDIDAYREAPPGLRIWAGSTVETGDLEALVPWLDWSFHHVRKGFSREAGSSGQTD